MPLSKAQHDLITHLVNEIEDCMGEKDFQRDFFESLTDQYKKQNFLSEKQIAALNRIYERVTR